MRPAAALLLLALFAAGPAGAQTAVQPKRQRAIPPRPTPARAPPAPSTPVPGATGRLTLSGLRAPGDGGATCRGACARDRYACEVREDSCASQWTTCLKSCGDPAAAPAGALLPR